MERSQEPEIVARKTSIFSLCVLLVLYKNLHLCFQSLLHSISTHYVSLQTRMRTVSHYISYL